MSGSDRITWGSSSRAIVLIGGQGIGVSSEKPNLGPQTWVVNASSPVYFLLVAPPL